MSIPVELEALADAVATYDYAYLVTVGDDGRPHVVAIRPSVDGRRLVVDVGRRTTSNAVARPAVSLVYPPMVDGGMSLVIDATAVVDGDALALEPVTAVLHRAAP